MPRRRFPVQDDSASEQDLASYYAQPVPSLARLSGEAGMFARRAAAEVPLDAPGESDEDRGTRRGRTSSLSRLWQKLEHTDERPWADRKRPSSRSNGARRSESLGRPREQDWSAHRMPSETSGPDEDLLLPHAPDDPVPFAAAATTGLFSREARRRNRADSAPAAPRWTAPDQSLRGDDSSDGNEYEASAAGRRPSAATLASAPVAPFSRGPPGRAESLRPPAGPDQSRAPTHPAQGLLFKPTFSPRQLQRLEHASRRVEKHDHKQETKGLRGAEVRVAVSLFEVLQREKRKQGKELAKAGGHGRSTKCGAEQPRRRASTAGGGLFGLAREVEEGLEHGFAGIEAGLRSEKDAVGGSGRREQVLEGVGGAAAVAGLVGSGYKLWQHERAPKSRGSNSGNDSGRRERGRSEGRSQADTAAPATFRDATAATPAAPSFPHTSLSARHQLQPTSPPPTPYFSSLSPAQHHLVQHAAAALLLKDYSQGRLHEKAHRAVGGFEHLTRVLEKSMEQAWEGAREHVGREAPRGGGKRLSKLFGTPLPLVTKHEGVDSFHGVDPYGTVRIPEFLDHCITALMQADVTVEGILRKNGKMRMLEEIISALDSSGGNDAVIDLAALDPITLASLFKRFLAALPDPILTSHLFKLFIACSHIENVNMRRRCMHLVICLMPKVNRDVLEVVFLFLNWLSQFAHISIKDGNRMDLTAIATVMAPTLLRPSHRDPKPVELNSMIAAVLSLLEDQHLLHSVPLELAHVLHFAPAGKKGDGRKKVEGLKSRAALLHALAKSL